MLPVAILAGGLATRLRPMTEKIPKALLEINGEPFAVRQLRLLRDQGVRQVVFCTGYLGDQIEAVIGDGSAFSLEISYSHDGEILRGTGGAVKNAIPLLGDAFLVLYGDSYLEAGYGKVAEYFLADGRPGLMTVFRNDGKWEPGNVRYERGEIVEYDKRNRTPEMRYVDYGLSAFHAPVFDRFPRQFDLAAVFQKLIELRKLAGYEVMNRFYEIGSREGIRDLEAHLGGKN